MARRFTKLVIDSHRPHELAAFWIPGHFRCHRGLAEYLLRGRPSSQEAAATSTRLAERTTR
jgi:hypothetical protein